MKRLTFWTQLWAAVTRQTPVYDENDDAFMSKWAWVFIVVMALAVLSLIVWAFLYAS